MYKAVSITCVIALVIIGGIMASDWGAKEQEKDRAERRERTKGAYYGPEIKTEPASTRSISGSTTSVSSRSKQFADPNIQKYYKVCLAKWTEQNKNGNTSLFISLERERNRLKRLYGISPKDAEHINVCHALYNDTWDQDIAPTCTHPGAIDPD